MEGLMQHVRDVLEREFPDAVITIEQATPADKVGGILVWDGFDGMDQIDRQRLLASKLRAGLSKEEQLRVTAILTLTHAETSIPSES